MGLPILIPANNEQDYLWDTLSSLPTDANPIIIPNGCTDQTIDIANTFAKETGAEVLVNEQASKIEAIKSGLRSIGSQAHDGYVILDADTEVLSSRFVSSVMRKLDPVSSAVIAGPLLMRGEAMGSITPWSAASVLHRAFRLFTDEDYFPTNGPAMILKSSPETVEEMLELPDFWPQEDNAIVHIHKANGAAMIHTLDPSLAASTSLRGRPNVVHRLIKGQSKYTQMRNHFSWGTRDTEDTIPYQQWCIERGINDLTEINRLERMQIYAAEKEST